MWGAEELYSRLAVWVAISHHEEFVSKKDTFKGRLYEGRDAASCLFCLNLEIKSSFDVKAKNLNLKHWHEHCRRYCTEAVQPRWPTSFPQKPRLVFLFLISVFNQLGRIYILKKRYELFNWFVYYCWNAFEYRRLFFYLSVWACTWKSPLLLRKAKQSLLVF